MLNRLLGKRLTGLQAPALGTSVSALLYLPVAAVLLVQGRFTLGGVGYAVAAGVLSSVVPYAADLIALRRVPQGVFGLFMSVHPVLAALAGLILLGQALKPHEWAGIAIVIAVLSSRPLLQMPDDRGRRALVGRDHGGPPVLVGNRATADHL